MHRTFPDEKTKLNQKKIVGKLNGKKFRLFGHTVCRPPQSNRNNFIRTEREQRKKL